MCVDRWGRFGTSQSHWNLENNFEAYFFQDREQTTGKSKCFLFSLSLEAGFSVCCSDPCLPSMFTVWPAYWVFMKLYQQLSRWWRTKHHKGEWWKHVWKHCSCRSGLFGLEVYWCWEQGGERKRKQRLRAAVQALTVLLCAEIVSCCFFRWKIHYKICFLSLGVGLQPIAYC